MDEFLVLFILKILILAFIRGLHKVLVILVLVDWHGICCRNGNSTRPFFPSLFTHILTIYAYKSSENSSKFLTSRH